jgi:hypothetical protein
LSKPLEINARAIQAQQQLKSLYPDGIRDIDTTELKNQIDEILDEFLVTKYLPKGQNSREYKRIVNRIISYLSRPG